jgi:hypothetical protein
MVHLKYALTMVASMVIHSLIAQNSRIVDPFDKVIVSPYIEVVFVEGPEERVTIESCSVDPAKLFVEVNGQTLRIYLEGAKETPKWNPYSGKKYEDYEPLYVGTVVKATVTYKRLSEVSLRGDEDQVFRGLLKAKDFRLKVYGNSEVTFEEVEMDEYHATLYGDNTLAMKSGKIASQHFTVYGVSRIECKEITTNTSKLTTYGEADYYVNASDEIKMTLFGEANLYYKGNPIISRKLNFGEMSVVRLD